MIVKFGKRHKGDVLETVIIKDPSYVLWALNEIEEPKGTMLEFVDEARRLIEIFDAAPILKKCDHCERQAGKLVLTQNETVSWQCHECPAVPGGTIISQYNDLYHSDFDRSSWPGIIKILSKAKGLLKRDDTTIWEFFRKPSNVASYKNKWNNIESEALEAPVSNFINISPISRQIVLAMIAAKRPITFDDVKPLGITSRNYMCYLRSIEPWTRAFEVDLNSKTAGLTWLANQAIPSGLKCWNNIADVMITLGVFGYLDQSGPFYKDQKRTFLPIEIEQMGKEFLKRFWKTLEKDVANTVVEEPVSVLDEIRQSRIAGALL